MPLKSIKVGNGSVVVVPASEVGPGTEIEVSTGSLLIVLKDGQTLEDALQLQKEHYEAKAEHSRQFRQTMGLTRI